MPVCWLGSKPAHTRCIQSGGSRPRSKLECSTHTQKRTNVVHFRLAKQRSPAQIRPREDQWNQVRADTTTQVHTCVLTSSRGGRQSRPRAGTTRSLAARPAKNQISLQRGAAAKGLAHRARNGRRKRLARIEIEVLSEGAQNKTLSARERTKAGGSTHQGAKELLSLGRADRRVKDAIHVLREAAAHCLEDLCATR